MSITALQLISLIKSSIEFDGSDVNITINNLIALNHSVNPEDLINTLLELDDISMSDNGFTIPKSYFE